MSLLLAAASLTFTAANSPVCCLDARSAAARERPVLTSTRPSPASACRLDSMSSAARERAAVGVAPSGTPFVCEKTDRFEFEDKLYDSAM